VLKFDLIPRWVSVVRLDLREHLFKYLDYLPRSSKISAGGFHNVFLDVSGSVWTMGCVNGDVSNPYYKFSGDNVHELMGEIHHF
jgi:hypothetical protein